MTANDQDKGKESSGESDAERLKEIKEEELKEAKTYYAQGETEGGTSPEEDLYKPLPEIDEDKEEMSFLKTVAFLGFGLAALAIVFILFFMRDLDERVVNMDSAVAKLDEKIEPFKKEVKESIEQINSDVTQLRGKFGDYERNMTIMELKRALITIQEVTASTNPDVQSKSSEVVASIQALLQELMGDSSAAPAATDQPAPAAPPVEAPPAEAPPAEAPPAEVPSTVETPAPAAEAAPSDDQAEAPAEEAVEEESSEDQERTAAAESVAEEGTPDGQQSETNVGEIELTSEEETLETNGDEELIEDDE